MYLVGIVVKVLSSFFYLISGLLWKNIISNNINYHVIFFRTIFSLLFSLIVLFIFSFSDEKDASLYRFIEVEWSEWLFTIAVCFFSFYGLYYFTNALKHGRYTIVAPFISMAALFSFITSLVLYSENVSVLSTIAFMLLVLALMYHQSDYLKDFHLSKEIYLSILSAFFWGVSFVLYPISIEQFGIYNFSLVLESCVLISCLYLLIIKQKKFIFQWLSKKEIWICFFIGLCVAGGNVSANYSLATIPVYLNIIISILFESLMLFIGLRWFQEEMKIKDWILVVAITAGTVLLFLN